MTREHLLLRLDAPLMSFGGVKVDKRGVTSDFPGLSLLAGLFANALGFDHRDSASTTVLQGRIRYAVRRDRPGERITDYQTVDLSQSHLAEPAWTTRGEVEGREGGSASEGTAQRYREYWADSVYTVVVRLEPAEARPDLSDLAVALRQPARPLFIGRKPCLPAAPLLIGTVHAPSLHEALQRAPAIEQRRDPGRPWTIWLPEDEPVDGPAREFEVFDERDWVNQIVAGRRIVRQILLARGEEATDDR